RNPFQGQHWYNKAYNDTLPAGLAGPAFVMFAPVQGRLHRIAVAYATRLRLEAAMPDGLGDDRDAMWHSHVLCNFTTPAGAPRGPPAPRHSDLPGARWDAKPTQDGHDPRLDRRRESRRCLRPRQSGVAVHRAWLDASRDEQPEVARTGAGAGGVLRRPARKR